MSLNRLHTLFTANNLFRSHFCKHLSTYFPSRKEGNEAAIALRPRKQKSKTERSTVFVDSKTIQVTAGRGGDGACAFLRLWANPTAGPSGGDGGNGGHVLFKASSYVKSLSHIKSVYHGYNGEKGHSKDCTGESAEHITIEVPIGTIFKNAAGKSVVDLDSDGQVFIAARGGVGGKGNHFFLSNEVRKPEVSEIGAEGESKSYFLELKKIAHVGLIGFPNAGKSTLLRAISRAKPKVASYPFTTLQPHIGVVEFNDYEQLFVADIPGLIPGAHQNKGLGISFLRHVERCVCLLYIVDLSSPHPATQLEVLKYEVGKYSPDLLKRPHAIVGNKMDLDESGEYLEAFRKEISLPVLGISAKRGHNVTLLLKQLRDIYNDSIREEDK